MQTNCNQIKAHRNALRTALSLGVLLLLLAASPEAANATAIVSGSNCGSGTIASTGTTASQLIIGCAAAGSLEVNAGPGVTTANAAYTSGSISLVSGYFGTGTGSILVNGNGAAGSATLNSSHSIQAGFSGGNGSITVQNGGLLQITTSGYELTIANSNSTGTLTADGANSKVISGSDIYVGGFTGATGTLTIQNGATVQTGTAGVSNGALQAGTGGNTSAAITVTGAGSSLLTHGMNLGDGFDAGSNVNLTIANGGSATIGTVAGAGSGLSIGASGSSMVTVTGAGSSLTINPITSGIVAGREVFIGGYGTGKLIVDQGAAVHAEGTHITVSGGFFGTQTSAPGTLTVKSGSTLAAADITLNPNGTLNGDGTIAADVILNGGAISPGNSPGTLTIDGDLNAMAGAFNFELASDALRDHVNVLGTATIGQDVFFNLLFGYAPAIDEVFSLESFFTVGGGPLAFDAGFDLGSHLNVTGLSAGESIFVTANSQRVRISGPVSVPEPATIALFVSGLAAAFYAGSRARQRVRI